MRLLQVFGCFLVFSASASSSVLLLNSHLYFENSFLRELIHYPYLSVPELLKHFPCPLDITASIDAINSRIQLVLSVLVESSPVPTRLPPSLYTLVNDHLTRYPLRTSPQSPSPGILSSFPELFRSYLLGPFSESEFSFRRSPSAPWHSALTTVEEASELAEISDHLPVAVFDFDCISRKRLTPSRLLHCREVVLQLLDGASEATIGNLRSTLEKVEAVIVNNVLLEIFALGELDIAEFLVRAKQNFALCVEGKLEACEEAESLLEIAADALAKIETGQHLESVIRKLLDRDFRSSVLMDQWPSGLHPPGDAWLLLVMSALGGTHLSEKSMNTEIALDFFPIPPFVVSGGASFRGNSSSLLRAIAERSEISSALQTSEFLVSLLLAICHSLPRVAFIETSAWHSWRHRKLSKIFSLLETSTWVGKTELFAISDLRVLERRLRNFPDETGIAGDLGDLIEAVREGRTVDEKVIASLVRKLSGVVYKGEVVDLVEYPRLAVLRLAYDENDWKTVAMEISKLAEKTGRFSLIEDAVNFAVVQEFYVAIGKIMRSLVLDGLDALREDLSEVPIAVPLREAFTFARMVYAHIASAISLRIYGQEDRARRHLQTAAVKLNFGCLVLQTIKSELSWEDGNLVMSFVELAEAFEVVVNSEVGAIDEVKYRFLKDEVLKTTRNAEVIPEPDAMKEFAAKISTDFRSIRIHGIRMPAISAQFPTPKIFDASNQEIENFMAKHRRVFGTGSPGEGYEEKLEFIFRSLSERGTGKKNRCLILEWLGVLFKSAHLDLRALIEEIVFWNRKASEASINVTSVITFNRKVSALASKKAKELKALEAKLLFSTAVASDMIAFASTLGDFRNLSSIAAFFSFDRFAKIYLAAFTQSATLMVTESMKINLPSSETFLKEGEAEAADAVLMALSQSDVLQALRSEAAP